MNFETPILFLIFNRPDTTKQVFDRIRVVKPKYLYIAADGPRSNKEGEGDLCNQTRNVVLDNIDWLCEVKVLFRDNNLGCGQAVSQAISWFFENVEEGIILEDDCLPSNSFFYFSEQMLDIYRNENIGIIGGYSFFDAYKVGYKNSHFIHLCAPIWGWATWKNRWVEINEMISPNYNAALWDILPSKNFRKIFSSIMDKIHLKEIDTWDVQFSYFKLQTKYKLDISPSLSLISNIGVNGTHYNGNENSFLNVNSNEIKVFETTPVLYDNKIEKLYFEEFDKIVKNDSEYFLKTLVNYIKRYLLIFYKLVINKK